MGFYFDSVTIGLYFVCYVFVSIPLLLSVRFDFKNPGFLFWVAYTLMLGLAPIVDVVSGRNMAFPINPFLYVLLPLFVFVLGYHYAKKMNTGIRVSRSAIEKFAFEPDLRVLYFLYVVCLLAGVSYLAITGLDFTSSDFNNERIQSQQGMGAFLYLNAALVIILPLLFAKVLNGEVRKKVFILLLVLALAVFILRGTRTLCLLPILMILLQILHAYKVDTSKLLLLTLFGVLIFVGFNFLRGSLSSSNASLFGYFFNFMCVSYENLSRVISAFPQSIDYQLGKTFFMNYQLILPGPGQDFTLWLKDELNMTFSGGGVTPSIVGDFYLNFGLFGVIAGMFLLGMFATFLKVFLEETKGSVFFVYLTVVFVLLVYGGISNSLLSVTINLFAFVGIGLLSVIAKKNTIGERS